MMKQENKQLLLQDISARLYYGVKISVPVVEKNMIFTVVGISESWLLVRNDRGSIFNINTALEFKPYYRPMSSMTEEEYDQLYIDSRVKKDSVDILDALENDMDAIQWLLKNHFDFMGLIPKGLAISTEEFNPYKD